MSETDSFIEEVTEEVRREALYGYVRKYGWIAVLLVVAVVGVTGFLEYRKAADRTAAQDFGDQVLAAIESGDEAAQAEALAGVTTEDAGAQTVIALRRAGALQQADDDAGAIALLEEISQGNSGIYADIAAYKLVLAKGTEMDASERDAILEDLAQPGSFLRPLAIEQQALAAIRDEDMDKAKELLTVLVEDSETPDSLQGRASQLLVAIGGELPAITRLLSDE